jgi:alpha-L-fucosidase
MYASKINKWNAAEMGPKRDIMGELSKAVRQQGLVFGLSFHRAEHWWFFNGGRKFNSDVMDPKYADLYGPAQSEGVQPDSIYLKDWLARTKELIDNYHPQVFYFDWWIEQPAFKPYWREFASYYYNKAIEWDKGVVVNYKDGAYPDQTAVLDIERGKLGKIRKLPWQTDTSVGKKSWGYIENEDYKSPDMIITDLIDIVSKNGNLLLNIGPAPDGTIPEKVKNVLLNIGKWLDINGEGIYGTSPWVKFGEGPTQSTSGSFSDNTKVEYTSSDFRFTTKGNTLYAYCLNWPKENVKITSLGLNILKGVKVENVSLLGSIENLKWKQEESALVISAPSKKPCEVAYGFKIKLSGHGMSELIIQHDVEDTLVAVSRIQNCESSDWSTQVNFIVNGKTLETKKIIIKPLAIEEVPFTYVQKKLGFYEITAGCNDAILPISKELLPGILMAGKWKFHKGNEEVWKSPVYNDKDWQVVNVPSYWENSSNYTEDNVYGWYRRIVVIPHELKGHKLILPLGNIDDVDETYFNGIKIGGMGTFPPNYTTAYDQQRKYTVNPEIIQYDKPNVIAVKVFDGTGGGGMGNGSFGMIEAK